MATSPGTTDLPQARAWERAQRGELEYWRRITRNEPHLDQSYAYFRRELPALLSQLEAVGLRLDEGASVLQIGCGLFDTIDLIPRGRRFAIDPLEDYFREVDDPRRDSAVERRSGMAEDLPYEDDSMDLVISHNMLDHVRSPATVTAECRRVLRPGGVFWLRVHVFGPLAIRTKALILRLGIDPKHIIFWTAPSLEQLVREGGFIPVAEDFTRDSRSSWHHVRHGRWRPLVKKLAGLTPCDYTLLLKDAGIGTVGSTPILR